MKAKLTFVIENDDGTPFSSNTTSWDGLDREQVNVLEGLGINFLQSLNAFGKQSLQGKKSKG